MDTPQELQQLLENLSIVLKCERLGKENNVFEIFDLDAEWYAIYLQLADIIQKLNDWEFFNPIHLSSLNDKINTLLDIEYESRDINSWEIIRLETFLKNLAFVAFQFYKSITVKPKGKITVF